MSNKLRLSMLAIPAAFLAVLGGTVQAQSSRCDLPLPTGTDLQQGKKYWACDGGHYLIFQHDGNLVIYDSADRPQWALTRVVPNWREIGRVTFQDDANLGAYKSDGTYVWSARHVAGQAGSTLWLTETGDLVIRAPGATIWHSGRN